MRITPIEIRQKNFEKSIRGFNIDEVNAYLHVLSIEWESLIAENEFYIHKTEKLKKEIKRLKSLERSLLKLIEASEKKSTIIIENAHLEASKIIEKAKNVADQNLKKNKLKQKSVSLEMKESLVTIANDILQACTK